MQCNVSSRAAGKLSAKLYIFTIFNMKLYQLKGIKCDRLIFFNCILNQISIRKAKVAFSAVWLFLRHPIGGL